MNFRYAVAATALWAIWGVSWWIAAFWTGARVSVAAPSSYRWLLWIAFAGYGALFVESPRVRHPLWLVPPWLGWAMVALVGAGLALSWWARIHLGALWAAGIVRREAHRIVDSGPYAWVRHPIYTAIIVGAIGLAAVKATPLSLLGAALIALGFALKAKVEERFLGAELGEADYAAYRARVPMLVPFAPTRGRALP